MIFIFMISDPHMLQKYICYRRVIKINKKINVFVIFLFRFRERIYILEYINTPNIFMLREISLWITKKYIKRNGFDQFVRARFRLRFGHFMRTGLGYFMKTGLGYFIKTWVCHLTRIGVSYIITG